MLTNIKQYTVRFGLKILKKLKILKTLNLILPSLQTSNISIPVIYGIGYDFFFEKEEWLLNLLKKLIPAYCQESYFIDVGVNIGQTLVKVRSIDKTTSYVGFEPNPNCLFYVYQLIGCNAFENVSVYPYALANSNTTFDLNLYSASAVDSTASIIPDFRSGKKNQIKVPVMAGNEVEALNACKAGIVKIDVEGSELEVIKGLMQIIQRDRPLIICEILPVYSEENVSRLARQCELESLLDRLNYKKVLIETSGLFSDIDSIGIHSDIDRVNYLFYPAEESSKLKLMTLL